MSAFHYTNNAPLLILVGPTGSGKTAVAIELCEILDGEIVSADSMQVYRSLDIGTAKATRAEQTRARHHLIDIVNPDEEYSAAQWAQAARHIIEEIRAPGKTPIICGGTGFYISALLHPQRLASAPPNHALRAELQDMAAREGNAALHTRLQTLDANAAARLHSNDVMRVVRAFEVAVYRNHQSGKQEIRAAPPEYSFAAFGLSVARAELYRRLDARVDAMLAAGFMDELKSLIEAGYGASAPLQGLGYKHMRAALDASENFVASVELWKRDTRRYAKRQATWFAHQLPVQWIETENLTPRALAQLIAQHWRDQERR
jgi:tRNA dimethylallyltransferase